MKVFCSDSHRLHSPSGELYGGEMVEPFERASRVEFILNALKSNGFMDIVESGDCDLSLVRQTHDSDYLEFLETAHSEWKAAGFAGDLIPNSFPVKRMASAPCPDFIEGKAGYYSIAAETAIVEGTWEAAKSSCASAQAACGEVESSAASAFALCRPPGHHATKDQFGGYCFINNAAVAALQLRRAGAGRVAVVDVDFHHGNGTQDIFYSRADVMFVSLHGDPRHAFPFFCGHAEETGSGDGEGTNLNYPMAPKSGWDIWGSALDDACARVGRFGPDALVISLGVDAYKEDPISFFALETEDFAKCGSRLSKIAQKSVIVMEGGYAIEEIGTNVVSFLKGFLGG